MVASADSVGGIGDSAVEAGLTIKRLQDTDRYMTLNIWPQHPGASRLRIIVVIDGDIVVHAEPGVGYVQRGEEKMSKIQDMCPECPAH
ncbi:MAG TPA: hypothetical protein VNI77_05220 [Nitrososphaera sp.]|nr:hypothetical protein [Nitrososphaera sp.]